MPTLLPGHQYDIFISYRQKDNRSDQWVTHFVQALREEIDATFKEEISIYFDVNPHDGLGETHDVDGSLKEKIKCLVLIPIVSQTYCDPKAFAWQKEFLAFVDFAKGDQFGLDIKLANGNIAKRVLPVRIHDFDETDKQLFGDVIGGVMRPIDFIYAEAGVNRPLQPDDSEERNQHKTRYRNQVNKVANAIKEIVQGMQAPQAVREPETNSTEQQVRKGSMQKVAVIGTLLIVLSILGFFYIPDWLGSRSTVVPEDKSIAVLPFKNMSNDPEQEYFGDGISEELINALAKMKNLKVAGRTSSFSFKDKNEDLRKVGESLGVSTILEGSVRKSGNTVRITAQLINVSDGFHLWTETFDRELSDIFQVQDEITAAIIEELKVHLGDEEIVPTKTVNPESYNVYLKARQLLAQRGINNLEKASELFYQALKLDSTYSPTYSGLSKTLSLLNNYSQGDQKYSKTHEESYVYAARALELDPNNSEAYMTIGIAKCWYDWEWAEAEKYLKKAVEMSPNDAEINNFVGDMYKILADFKNAEKYEQRALELDPMHAVNHWDLGEIYTQMRQPDKAIRYYRSGLKIDPVFLQLLYPTLTHTIKNKTFIRELDSLFTIIDKSNIPQAILLQIKTSLAIGKRDLDQARQYVNELAKFGEQGSSSSAYLFDYYNILGDEDQAVYWATRAVEAGDGLLIYQPFLLLPEDYESERIRKALASPKLDKLYEIRRRNLGDR